MRRIAVTLVLAAALAACSKKSEQAPAPAPAAAPAHGSDTATPVAKDPATAKQMIASGALVLDVRTPEEYADGHVASAQNMPVDSIHDRLPQIAQLTGDDKAKPIVVYCAAGRRAARAKKTLEEAGYSNVVNGGGYDDFH